MSVREGVFTRPTVAVWFVGTAVVLTILALLSIAYLVYLPAASAFPPDQPSDVKIAMADGGHGSGVYIGDGIVITAAHVARHDGLSVVTHDEVSRTATVLWTDPEHDIAALRIVPDGITASRIDCSGPVVGERVTAFGSPADLDFLRTSGVVAGEARTIDIWKSVVPVDMTVVQGMSGGPVMNSDSNVVGITVGLQSTITGTTGIGIVVPSTVVFELLAR